MGIRRQGEANGDRLPGQAMHGAEQVLGSVHRLNVWKEKEKTHVSVCVCVGGMTKSARFG